MFCNLQEAVYWFSLSCVVSGIISHISGHHTALKQYCILYVFMMWLKDLLPRR